MGVLLLLFVCVCVCVCMCFFSSFASFGVFYLLALVAFHSQRKVAYLVEKNIKFAE